MNVREQDVAEQDRTERVETQHRMSVSGTENNDMHTASIASTVLHSKYHRRL